MAKRERYGLGSRKFELHCARMKLLEQMAYGKDLGEIQTAQQLEARKLDIERTLYLAMFSKTNRVKRSELRG